MTQPEIPLIPLERRPAFAAKLVRIWRLQHLARGEELAVIVLPGEWPTESFPAVVYVAGEDVPVKYDKCAGGPGGIMILGRIGDKWRVAYNLAALDSEHMQIKHLALTCMYGELSDDPNMKFWMHPSPTTGEVPMWEMPRPSLRR